MPDNEPIIRMVTLEAALEDVSRDPRPFIIINRERHTGDIPVPTLVLERLGDDFAGDLLVAPTTLAELNKAHLPLGRHREQFMAGEPVTMTVAKVHETPECAPGGQNVLGLEERARDGLYVTVAMATEKLRACADHRERRKMKTDTRRFEIFDRLEPELPLELSAKNNFDAGQRLIAKWYPGPTAYQTMKLAYTSVLDLLARGANPLALEAEQIDLVRTASAVYAKTDAFLKAQHEMSTMIRELMDSDEFKNAPPAEQYDMQARLLRERAPALHQEMAHNMQGGPSLAQFVQVAATMDFNPAWVFGNVVVCKGELECAMLLGRAERGEGAMLQADHIERLKRWMAQADDSDGNGADVDAEVEAARCLRDFALRVKTGAGWTEFFAIAEPDGREFWITKAL